MRPDRPFLRPTLGRVGPLVVALLLIVVVAAGASGVVLLAAPNETDRYFAWTLRPGPAAAAIGGLYLASAVAFAVALLLPWSQVRPLVVGVLGLAVPTLVLTIVHDEVFDFGRWQAVVWVALFGFAPAFVVAILATRPGDAATGPALRTGTRLTLGVVAALLVLLAVAIWVDSLRDELQGASPVPLLRLTGTYLGAWASFLALLCAVAAVGGRWDHARLPLLTTAAAAGGALLAWLRTVGDLRHPGATIAVTIGIGVLAAVLYRVERPFGPGSTTQGIGASGR